MRIYLLAIILLFLFLFSFADFQSIPIAKATTWVEGSIVDNTTWTASNSPYVLSGTVSVAANATLLIEPGVAVRAGGYFSIRVYGTLTANGIDSNRILFTSNRVSPAFGDWSGIDTRDNGRVYLNYCRIEYATVLVNGGLRSEIRSTVFGGKASFSGANTTLANCQFNSVRVIVTGAYSEISQCQFINCTLQHGGRANKVYGNSFNGAMNTLTRSGIYQISDDSEVWGNDITGYIDGILISSGYNTWVHNNNIHGNTYGIRFGSSGTYYADLLQVTNNSIWSNTVGVQHESYVHWAQVHYNNIFGNAVGSNATGSSDTNSTYNYWGSASGPYHISLNPEGQGNIVGGIGTNLKFIPFLTSAASAVIPEFSSLAILLSAFTLVSTATVLCKMYGLKRKT